MYNGITVEKLEQYLKDITIKKFVPITIGTGRRGAMQIFRSMLSDGWPKELIRKGVEKHGGLYIFKPPKLT